MFQSAQAWVLAAVAGGLIVSSGAVAANAPASTTAKAGRAPTWSEVAKWPDFTHGQWVIKGSLVNTAGIAALPLKPELKDQAAAARAVRAAIPPAAASRTVCQVWWAVNSSMPGIPFCWSWISTI